jgi:hypothetical protein
MTFCSQVRRTCGTTHFIRPCTILHATGIGLPPNFEDSICSVQNVLFALFLFVHDINGSMLPNMKYNVT